MFYVFSGKRENRDSRDGRIAGPESGPRRNIQNTSTFVGKLATRLESIINHCYNDRSDTRPVGLRTGVSNSEPHSATAGPGREHGVVRCRGAGWGVPRVL